MIKYCYQKLNLDKLISTLKFYIEEEVALRELVTIKSQTEIYLTSLKINPGDAYVLNYLAYSWLERRLQNKNGSTNA